MTETRDRVVAGAFVASAVLSGGNSVAIRFSNRELAPLWGATLRFVVAGVLLAAVMAALRLRPPRGQALTGAVLYGVLQFGLAFGLYYYALVRIHAGLGQTLLALVPLATLLLAGAQGQERLRPPAVVGALVGLAGVGVISSGSWQGSVPLPSLLAVLGSVLCFAQAAIVVRRFPPVHPVVLNGVGMVVAAVMLLAASLVSGQALDVPRKATTWAAVGYVAVVGSIAVFLLYVYVLQRWTASRAVYVMVIIPFVAVALSAWLHAEPIGPGLVAGGLLVIAGVHLGALRRTADTEVSRSGPRA